MSVAFENSGISSIKDGLLHEEIMIKEEPLDFDEEMIDPLSVTQKRPREQSNNGPNKKQARIEFTGYEKELLKQYILKHEELFAGTELQIHNKFQECSEMFAELGYLKAPQELYAMFLMMKSQNGFLRSDPNSNTNKKMPLSNPLVTLADDIRKTWNHNLHPVSKNSPILLNHLHKLNGDTSGMTKVPSAVYKLVGSSKTNSTQVTNSNAKSTQVTNSSTKSAHAPNSATKSANVLNSSTKSAHVPNSGTKSAPNSATKSAPNSATKSANVLNSNTKSAHVPNSVTKSAQPQVTTNGVTPPSLLVIPNKPKLAARLKQLVVTSPRTLIIPPNNSTKKIPECDKSVNSPTKSISSTSVQNITDVLNTSTSVNYDKKLLELHEEHFRQKLALKKMKYDKKREIIKQRIESEMKSQESSTYKCELLKLQIENHRLQNNKLLIEMKRLNKD